jgi:hypothetical protein
LLIQAQAKTPQQRKANQLYEKREAAKRGKPVAVTQKTEVKKPPISKYWIGNPSYINPLTSGALLFVLLGGALFELIRMFY